MAAKGCLHKSVTGGSVPDFPAWYGPALIEYRSFQRKNAWPETGLCRPVDAG